MATKKRLIIFEKLSNNFGDVGNARAYLYGPEDLENIFKEELNYYHLCTATPLLHRKLIDKNNFKNLPDEFVLVGTKVKPRNSRDEELIRETILTITKSYNTCFNVYLYF